ncbi:MAG: hypothetical protein PHH44_01640 [bacterium]|nr:hypothetical protein [bacterium]
MTEQKHSEVAELTMQNVVGNKYKVVLASAVEAKKMKELDKDNSASLGKISIEAMNKVLIKANKKKDKEDAEELAEELEK